ncbi:hypothetical protein GJ496_001709 [Pomphorhynchus laevis]|nr:hypothetical protein GJ496_001709 [Pomphorhynchus laevis]
MIFIPFKIEKAIDELPNDMIISMQGEIKPAEKNSLLNGKYFGDLHFKKTGEPLIITNQHIHKGNVKTLKNPIVKFRKQKNADGDIEYVAVGIIRKELLFNSRPLPNIPAADVSKRKKTS